MSTKKEEQKRPAAKKNIARVRWASLRQVRWGDIYEPLRVLMLQGVVQDGLKPKTKRRVLALSQTLTLDEGDDEMYLYTRTPPPELTDKSVGL